MTLNPMVFRQWKLVLVVVAAVAVAGCAQKAKSVQLGAAQLKLAANEAIDKIDAMRQAETSAPPQSASEAADKFVSLVEGSSQPISNDTLSILANPLSFGSAQSEKEWAAVLSTLRSQYAAFASVFENLDQGSLLAAADVKQAIPPLDKLTAQMAAIAKTLQENPAVFVVERGFLAADLEAVRDSATLSADQKRTQLLALRDRLLAIVSREEQVTNDAVVQALKTARLGVELRKLLAAYDTLTLDDLMDGLQVAFQATSTITGRDLSSLESKTDDVIAELKATPGVEPLINAALETVSSAIGGS